MTQSLSFSLFYLIVCRNLTRGIVSALPSPYGDSLKAGNFEPSLIICCWVKEKLEPSLIVWCWRKYCFWVDDVSQIWAVSDDAFQDFVPIMDSTVVRRWTKHFNLETKHSGVADLRRRTLRTRRRAKPFLFSTPAETLGNTRERTNR